MLIWSIGNVKGVNSRHMLQVDGFSNERAVNEADALFSYPVRKTLDYQLVGVMAGSGNNTTAFVRTPDSRWWHCDNTDIRVLDKESDIDAESPILWAFVRSDIYAVPETTRFVRELFQKVNDTDEAVLIIGYCRKREDEFAPDALRKGANIFTLDIQADPAHPRAFRFNFRNIADASLDKVQAMLRPLFKEIVFEWSTFKFVHEEDYSAVFRFFGRLLKEKGRLLIIGACGGLIDAPAETHPLKDLAIKLKQYWTEDEKAAYAVYRAEQISAKQEKIMIAADFDPVTQQPFSVETEFATATFVEKRGEAASVYVDMLAEKQTRRFGYGPDTRKASFYGDIFVAVRTSDLQRSVDDFIHVCELAKTQTAAFLVIGASPGHDGASAPDVFLNNEQVFTMSDERALYTVTETDSAAAARANQRFIHFDVNSAMAVNEIKDDRKKTMLEGSFDEIMFDTSTYKFVNIDQEPNVIKMLRTLLKPGGSCSCRTTSTMAAASLFRQPRVMLLPWTRTRTCKECSTSFSRVTLAIILATRLALQSTTCC